MQNVTWFLLYTHNHFLGEPTLDFMILERKHIDKGDVFTLLFSLYVTTPRELFRNIFTKGIIFVVVLMFSFCFPWSQLSHWCSRTLISPMQMQYYKMGFFQMRKGSSWFWIKSCICHYIFLSFLTQHAPISQGKQVIPVGLVWAPRPLGRPDNLGYGFLKLHVFLSVNFQDASETIEIDNKSGEIKLCLVSCKEL